MIPMTNQLLMIPAEKTLTETLIKKIGQSSYSRIPVYQNHNKNNIYGTLVVKSMVDIKSDMGKALKDSTCLIEKPLIVTKDTNLLEMLNHFQKRTTRIAMISDETKEVGEDKFNVRVRGGPK